MMVQKKVGTREEDGDDHRGSGIHFGCGQERYPQDMTLELSMRVSGCSPGGVG